MDAVQILVHKIESAMKYFLSIPNLPGNLLIAASYSGRSHFCLYIKKKTNQMNDHMKNYFKEPPNSLKISIFETFYIPVTGIHISYIYLFWPFKLIKNIFKNLGHVPHKARKVNPNAPGLTSICQKYCGVRNIKHFPENHL
jgi:hypothetical protein